MFTISTVYNRLSSWRSGASSPRVSAPSIQPSTSQRNDVSNWRNQPSLNTQTQMQTLESAFKKVQTMGFVSLMQMVLSLQIIFLPWQ